MNPMNPINILIVDDDANARKTFNKVLKLKGYNVEEAGTGSQALELAKEKFFHLVALDVRLPDLSGLDVLKAIREINEDTMVIMMTGYASLDSSIEAVNKGAYSYITKPVNMDQALVIIEKALEKQRLSLENKRLLKELKEANEKLKQLDQLKSDFVSTVSHELRTPLAITKEGISLVLDEVTGKINDQQKRMLVVAKNNIDRLTHLINDLLDISKIEAGKIELKKEVVDLVNLAANITSIFEPSARDKGLELRKNFHQLAKLEMYIDKDKISQVLVNLLSNALKFTPLEKVHPTRERSSLSGFTPALHGQEKGFVEVSLEDKGEKIECSVLDNGIGIAQEDLPRVFEKFQQFTPLEKVHPIRELCSLTGFTKIDGQGEGGTGLGLAICKGIIELHRGEIWVESKLGIGTKFTFSLSKSNYGKYDLFKEHIATALKSAVKWQVPLSLVVFELRNFEEVQGQEEGKIDLILDDLECIIRNNLRRKADEGIKTGGAILLVLTETKKDDALIAAGRLQQLFNEYLDSKKKEISIKFDIKIVCFPEDGKNEEELFRKLL